MDQETSDACGPAAKSRNRPHSRASTTSVHSVTTQPNADHSEFTDTTEMFGGQWITQNDLGTRHPVAAGNQMTPEDMILRAANQMQANGHNYHMNAPSLHSAAHSMPYHSHNSASRHPLPVDQYPGNGGFIEDDSHILHRDDDVDSMSGISAGLRVGSGRSSANNELEMRQLFGANRHRSLQEVAAELHGNERGPNSERARQVFAMLWINSICSKGKGSVPRGRVYAFYASRCATEKITVLNPASFGKLVRVLFPGLKTRRLGVRGESKYHYVNFELLDDHPDVRATPLRSQTPSGPQPAVIRPQIMNRPAPSRSPPDLPPLPTPHLSNFEPRVTPTGPPGRRLHSLYNQPDVSGQAENCETASRKTPILLAFPPVHDDSFDQAEPLALPDIAAYLPAGTDPDCARSLSALYRSHCTSLVECMRYVREKNFFHLYVAFLGTLTSPVQKLFGNPHLAPWIEECDFVMYQRMMKILSGLTLQVVPKPVLNTIRNISEQLVPHIRWSMEGQPDHVVLAKEGPATIFAALLDRLLRVNLTAHAAANMLCNSANRDQMYVDWVKMIRARKVAECVPTRAMDDVVEVMIHEVRDLLDPVDVPLDIDCLIIYANARSRGNGGSRDQTSSSDSNVLDRWVTFLRSLPIKFPYASHADIVWCVERVGSAIMRDLTLSQGKSFGSWWVTKTWIDEMVCFLAEQGGFMKQRSTNAALSGSTPPAANKELSLPEAGFSRGSKKVGMTHVSQTQPGRAPFPPPSSKEAAMGTNGGDANDDSGIGIRTPEDEFPRDKFSFAEMESSASLTHDGLEM